LRFFEVFLEGLTELGFFKSGLSATGFQKDWKARLSLSGAAQRPARWNDVKDKNNKAKTETKAIIVLKTF